MAVWRLVYVLEWAFVHVLTCALKISSQSGRAFESWGGEKDCVATVTLKQSADVQTQKTKKQKTTTKKQQTNKTKKPAGKNVNTQNWLVHFFVPVCFSNIVHFRFFDSTTVHSTLSDCLDPWPWIKRCLTHWCGRVVRFDVESFPENGRAKKREATQYNTAKLIQAKQNMAAPVDL